MYEVKALRIKPKAVKSSAVDPFSLRKYISGLAQGQLSDTAQLEWKFTHKSKTPILLEVNGAAVSGTIVLNDEPIAYYAGVTSGCHLRVLLDASSKAKTLKRGANVLRFAPDPRQDRAAEQISRAVSLYECTEAVTEQASWAFAKWEPPMLRDFHSASSTKSLRGMPCWWRCTFAAPAAEDIDQPLWFETKGLSKGQLFVNGHNLGRYFSAIPTGASGSKAVGPQTRLFVPSVFLRHDQENEVILFDEHGFDPSRCKFVAAETGDLD